MKFRTFIIGVAAVFNVASALSQSRQAESLKKVKDSYYVESDGKEYLVNPSVVAVKFKDGVSAKQNFFGYSKKCYLCTINFIRNLS